MVKNDILVSQFKKTFSYLQVNLELQRHRKNFKKCCLGSFFNSDNLSLHECYLFFVKINKKRRIMWKQFYRAPYNYSIKKSKYLPHSIISIIIISSIVLVQYKYTNRVNPCTGSDCACTWYVTASSVLQPSRKSTASYNCRVKMYNHII